MGRVVAHHGLRDLSDQSSWIKRRRAIAGPLIRRNDHVDMVISAIGVPNVRLRRDMRVLMDDPFLLARVKREPRRDSGQLFSLARCIGLPRRDRSGQHPSQQVVPPQVMVDKGRSSMEQRQTEQTISCQTMPLGDRPTPREVADLRQVEQAEHVASAHEGVDHPAQGHDDEKTVEQIVGRHGEHLERAAVDRRQATAVRGAPRDAGHEHAGNREAERDMNRPNGGIDRAIRYPVRHLADVGSLFASTADWPDLTQISVKVAPRRVGDPGRATTVALRAGPVVIKRPRNGFDPADPATVALTLVEARDGGPRPATDVIDAAMLPIPRAIGPTLERRTQRQRNPHPLDPLAWLAWIIARLGGWNCYYKPPGPKTMHTGWAQFATMAAGFTIANDATDRSQLNA